MSKRPRVSVIMPVHNGQQFIADALHSIRRQGIDSLEIVVVDDGSTDRTREVLETEFPECHYLFQDRAGPASARNAGLAAARGELIGFLDADDLFAGGGSQLSMRPSPLRKVRTSRWEASG
jgi:glycosyltransferase involved in cell wall biosynthesis